MGKTIGIYNRKGGVGKSTSVINIGSSLSMLNKKVLLIDGESQASITRYFYRDDPNFFNQDMSSSQKTATILEMLNGDCDIKDAIYEKNCQYEKNKWVIKGMTRKMVHIQNECSFDLLAGNTEFDFYNVEDTDRVKNVLESVKQEYDYILIDFPPAFNAVTLSYLIACDYLMVPLKIKEDESIHGYLDLVKRVEFAKEQGSNVEILGAFYTFVHANWKSHAETKEISMNESDLFFESSIREINSVIENAKLLQLPLCVFAEDEKVTQDYMSLAKEIIKRTKE